MQAAQKEHVHVSIPLEKEVEAVNRLYDEYVSHETSAKDNAAEIGEILIRVKEELPHGEFKSWIEENFKFSYRKARKYKQVAELKMASRGQFDACTSINEVLKLTKKPKQDNVVDIRDAANPDVPQKFPDVEKIKKLQSLADHPNTDPGTKANAARKLEQIEDDLVNQLVDQIMKSDAELQRRYLTLFIRLSQYDVEEKLGHLQKIIKGNQT